MTRASGSGCDGGSWTEASWIRDPKHVAWKAPGDGKYRLYVIFLWNKVF